MTALELRLKVLGHVVFHSVWPPSCELTVLTLH